MFIKDEIENTEVLDAEIVKYYPAYIEGNSVGDPVDVIDETADGKILGFFAEDADEQIEQLSKVEIHLDLPEAFDPKKVSLSFIAQGEKKGARDLKGFRPDEVGIQAFYGKDAVGKPLSLKAAELCFPEAQPAPQPAPAPAPAAPTPPAPSHAAPPSADPPIDEDELQLFFRPGKDEEELVRPSKYAFFYECFERGFVVEGDFEYRYVNKVLGGVYAACTEDAETPFKMKDLKAAIGK